MQNHWGTSIATLENHRSSAKMDLRNIWKTNKEKLVITLRLKRENQRAHEKHTHTHIPFLLTSCQRSQRKSIHVNPFGVHSIFGKISKISLFYRQSNRHQSGLRSEFRFIWTPFVTRSHLNRPLLFFFLKQKKIIIYFLFFFFQIIDHSLQIVCNSKYFSF